MVRNATLLAATSSIGLAPIAVGRTGKTLISADISLVDAAFEEHYSLDITLSQRKCLRLTRTTRMN